MPLTYTVRCTFDDPAVGEEWIAWLRDEHLTDVCAAGALDAEVIRLDGEPLTCEVRYRFRSRDAFTTYEHEHAPRPLERGLKYERITGEIAV
jgi:hypothetical protein